MKTLSPMPSLAEMQAKARKANAQSKFRSLVIYAKMLGLRWSVKVEFDSYVRTAKTNGKVIKLRPCEIGNDEDIVLIEGLLDHEAGVHCRQTDFEVAERRLQSAPEITRSLANVFEDVFGERELKKVRPGCARTISAALDIMIARGIFGPPEPHAHPASLLVGGLVNGLRSRKLGQVALEPFFQQRWLMLEQVLGRSLATVLWLTAQKVDSVSCTSEAIDLAEEVTALVRQLADQSPPPPPAAAAAGDQSGEESDDGSSDTSQERADTGGDDSHDSTSAEQHAERSDCLYGGPASDPEEPLGDEDDAHDGPSAGSSPTPKSRSSDEGQYDDPLEGSDDFDEPAPPSRATAQEIQAAQATVVASTDESGSGEFADALSEALDQSDAPTQAAAAGQGAGSHWELDEAIPIECDAIEAVIADLARPVAVRLGSRLDELLQAETTANVDLKRSGRRLDPRRLVRLATAADVRLFRTVDDVDELDTCVLLLTDISTSMSAGLSGSSQGTVVTRIQGASAATRALGDTLNRFNVPFAVRYFGERLTRVKEFDQPWRKARSMYWARLEGNTCTDQALLSVVPELAARPEARKLLAVTTDGIPADTSATVLALTEARRLGIDVTVVLVTSSGLTDLSLAAFVTALDDACIPHATARAADELAQAVFDAVEAALA